MSDTPSTAAPGAVYLWTYLEQSASFPGWHLTADGAGCQALLVALDQLAPGGSITLPTRPPTPAILAVPHNRRAQTRAASHLTFCHEAGRAVWRLEERDGGVTFFASADRLITVRRRIVDVSRGRGDSWIGADYKRSSREQRLWFWWMPRPAR